MNSNPMNIAEFMAAALRPGYNVRERCQNLKFFVKRY